MRSLSFRLPTNPRSSKRTWLPWMVAASIGVGAGLLGWFEPRTDLRILDVGSVPVANAQAHCGVNPGCTGGDVTVTSALDVYHRVSPGGLTDDPVQLDDSENWTITAYWYTEAGGVCQCAFEEQASVTYAVTHSGTGWSGTCTGCNAMIGPIYAVTICDINADNCSSYDDDYRLSVNVAAQNGTGSGGCGGFARFIERVEYSVTNIDDGDAFNASTCNLGAAVTPTQNTFSATDVGAFECPYNCSQVGSSLSIVYQ